MASPVQLATWRASNISIRWSQIGEAVLKPRSLSSRYMDKISAFTSAIRHAILLTG